MRSRHFIILMFLVATCLVARAQGLRSGEFTLLLTPNGSLGTPSEMAIIHQPSGKRMMRSAGIWISAEDAQQRIYAAGHQKGRIDDSDFWPGPMDTFLVKAKQPSDWDKTWLNNRTDIERHRRLWNEANYQMPAEIRDWPANGVENTLPVLAPFADLTDNGRYDPEEGDFPIISGDLSVYALFNDEFDEHKVSLAAPLKCGFFVEAWVNNDLPGVFFIKYRILNQSSLGFDRLNWSFYATLDAGNPSDNIGATDSLSGSLMVFNADENDDGEEGFGSRLPFLMVTPINFQSTSSMLLDTLQHAVLPSSDLAFRNLQQGKWADGNELTYGGDGYRSGVPTNFAFTWPAWQHPAGYSIALMNAERNKLEFRESVEWTIAITCKLSNAYAKLGMEALIKESVNQLQPALSTAKNVSRERIEVYPNPTISGQRFFLSSKQPYDFKQLALYDLEGRLIKQWDSPMDRKSYELPPINPGCYVLEVHEKNARYRFKLLVTSSQ